MSNRNDDNNRNPINNNNNRDRPQLQHFVERTVQAASALPARFQRRLVITWHALARLVGAYESERKEEMGATEVERINLLLQAVHRFLQLLEGAYGLDRLLSSPDTSPRRRGHRVEPGLFQP